MNQEEITPRQREILQCLADGLTAKEICKALGLAIGTVKTHLRMMYTTMRVCSGAEAVMEGVRRGWLDPKAPPKHRHEPFYRT